MSTTFKLFLHLLAHGPDTGERHVHFHRGPSGSPAACHDPACRSPHLTVEG